MPFKRSPEKEAERRAAYALFEAGETIQTIKEGKKSKLTRTALYDVRRSWLSLHAIKQSGDGKKPDLASLYHWQPVQQAEDHSVPYDPVPNKTPSRNPQGQISVARDKPDITKLGLSAFRGYRKNKLGGSRLG